MSEILNSRRRFSPPVEPVLIGVALAVLLLAVWWLAVTPRGGSGAGGGEPRLAVLEQRVASLEPFREGAARSVERLRDLDALEGRLLALEQRQGPDIGARLAPLEQRLVALEQRLTANQGSMERRVAALEQSPDLSARLQALEARPQADHGPLERRIAALEARPDPTAEMEARFARLQSTLASNFRVAYAELQRQMRLVETLRTRLASGQPFGDALAQLNPAEPALARFATQPPPTEAQLRLRFADQARAVRGTLAGTRADGTRPGFWESAWLTIKGLVTVRRGDQVLLGGPADAGLNHIGRLLEAYDLAGAVAGVAELPPAAREALKPWAEDAQAVVAARDAINRLASRE